MFTDLQIFDKKTKIISQNSKERFQLRTSKMILLDYLVLKAQGKWGWSDLLRGYENEKIDYQYYSIRSHEKIISEKYESKVPKQLEMERNRQKLKETQNLKRKRQENNEDKP